MNNELKRCTLESLDDITDKIHDGTFFEGENEKLIKKLLFEEYAKMHIVSKKMGKCVCPNCCNKSIKKSHTIPRGMSLDIIAENKKVVMPILIEKYPVREYFIEAAEIGIGQASIFPGFCKKHELIFQTYEKRQKIDKQDDVIKQLFRNVTYNCFILERRIELSKNIIERYKDIRNQAAYNYLKKSELKAMLKEVIISGEDKNIINLTFHQQKLIDYYTKLEKYKMNLWKIIDGSDADITSISVILDVLFPVSICGCTIQVAVYDNRLEITSPGKLPMGQTMERMKEGYSKIRNEALAHAFAYMNLIEHWGSGIPRIIDKVKAAGLREPEFIGGEVDLRINIYRGQVATNNAIINANGTKNGANGVKCGVDDGTNIAEVPLNKEQTQIEKLLQIIEKNPSATQAYYAEKMGISKRTVSRMFASLQEKGRLVQGGTKRKANWKIIR